MSLHYGSISIEKLSLINVSLHPHFPRILIQMLYIWEILSLLTCIWKAVEFKQQRLWTKFFWNLLKIRVWLASVHNFIFHSHHAHVFSPINAIFLSNIWGKYFPLNLGFCPSWFQNASFNNLSCKFFSLYKAAEVIVFSCHDILFALFSQNIWEIIGRICQLSK